MVTRKNAKGRPATSGERPAGSGATGLDARVAGGKLPATICGCGARITLKNLGKHAKTAGHTQWAAANKETPT